ncbi:UNVERIFIED_CONTAM: cytochrome [Sesamum radiatum]|uniref:Cytochrome n=1 Tax=Sesamum radiatum TaxID=300843 RepID=A0AAW2R0S4_SESRA
MMNKAPNPMGIFLHPKPAAAAFLAVVVSILILRVLLPRKQGKKQKHPVGGTIFDQLLNFSRLHDYMTDLAAKHKSYRLIAPFRSEVYTSDPANVEHILKTKFDNYGKDLFMKTTLDSIFRVAFGVELDSTCGSNEEGARFTRAFDDASEITTWRYVDLLWKIKRVLNLGMEAELKKNISVVDEFVYKLIHSKIEHMKKSRDECNPKMCFSDDIMPDGYHVKKGDAVVYLPYAMGRMKFIWGDDAEEFKPERWLDENGCFQQENPFKFPAFQAGPRICLGKEFAYRQMKIFSAVLLRFFVFKLSDESKAVKYRTMINLHVDGGLSVVAFDRSDNESE